MPNCLGPCPTTPNASSWSPRRWRGSCGTIWRQPIGAAVVVRAPSDLRFSVWAQDPCVVVEDDDGAITLLEPAAFHRASDRSTRRVRA
jgi:hypothetical protein